MDLAQACGACIVGFNVRSPPSSVSQAATRASIKVSTFSYCRSMFDIVASSSYLVVHMRIAHMGFISIDPVG